MKNTLLFMLLSMLLVSGAYAEGNNETKATVTNMEDRAVIAHDFDLELEVENGVVSADWDRFDTEGFEWFKLVYSTTNTNPVYPDDATVFIGNKDQRESSFKLQNGSHHYVRLCAVILNADYSKDRYCGATQKITATVDASTVKKQEAKKEEIKKQEVKKEEMKKEEYKKNDDKKEYLEKKKEEIQDKIQEKKEEQKNKVINRLSENLQKRVNVMLGKFIITLESKSYSDEKNIELIDTVISRLKLLGEKPNYGTLTSYMVLWLEDKKMDYNPELSELEKIFQID